MIDVTLLFYYAVSNCARGNEGDFSTSGISPEIYANEIKISLCDVEERCHF